MGGLGEYGGGGGRKSEARVDGLAERLRRCSDAGGASILLLMRLLGALFLPWAEARRDIPLGFEMSRVDS